MSLGSDAAGPAAASISATVPCGAHRKNWSALEHDHAQAYRHEKALTRAIIGAVCRPCPAREERATWATLDRYTGFAAGTWCDARRPKRDGPRPKGDGSLSIVTVPMS